jgi:hypothetical protein
MAVKMALNVKLMSTLTAIRIAFYLALLLDVVFMSCAIYTLTLIQPTTTSTFSYASLVYGVVVVSQHHQHTSSLVCGSSMRLIVRLVSD